MRTIAGLADSDPNPRDAATFEALPGESIHGAAAGLGARHRRQSAIRGARRSYALPGRWLFDSPNMKRNVLNFGGAHLRAGAGFNPSCNRNRSAWALWFQ
jgi:hypothetical protein